MINLFKVYNSEARSFKYLSNIKPKSYNLYNVFDKKDPNLLLQEISINGINDIIQFGFKAKVFNIYHILSGRITFNPLSVSATHTEGAIEEFRCYCCKIVFRWFNFFKNKKMYILKPHIVPYIKQNCCIPFKELSKTNGGLNC